MRQNEEDRFLSKLEIRTESQRVKGRLAFKVQPGLSVWKLCGSQDESSDL